MEAARGLRPDHPAYEALLNCFERALVTMHKMPRIWEMLLGLLHSLKLLTRARRCCDRALCSLPITQHTRVWNHYLSLVRQPHVPAQTALKVYRRYLQLEPGHAEEYIEFLKARGLWNEAAVKLADLVNDDRYASSVEPELGHTIVPDSPSVCCPATTRLHRASAVLR